MNNRFFELQKDKKDRILNAALQVFSKYEYKKASTEEIASRAGISKALLFHYFGSKKELYLYLYSYATDYLIKRMSQLHNYAEQDFFRILADAQCCKMAVLAEYPDIMLFMLKVYYEEDESIRPETSSSFADIISASSERFIARVDKSRFRDGVDAQMVLNIVLWMSEGFMRSRTAQQLADLDGVNDEYLSHLELLRQQFYKPEYLS